MRLLYVALTRAKNKLYLVGEYDLEKIRELTSYCDIISRKSYYDWILGLLNDNQKETLINSGKIILNDGKQTPTYGHPVFIAQHATATCCRGCLYKWHKIKPGIELSVEQINYVVTVIIEWIKKQKK